MVRNRKETTEKSKKKLGLSTQIFIALLAGALLGVVIHYWIPSSYIKDTVIVEGVLYVIGQGFIRLMQMLVVPLVFCSLVCGSMSIGDSKTLGKVGSVHQNGIFSVIKRSLTCTASLLVRLDAGSASDAFRMIWGPAHVDIHFTCPGTLIASDTFAVFNRDM